ncbi:esterase/lipase family protein [Clostridium massiliodielmoense]|uniref:esterase/lipase family protein n=1 Tax=Clostridium massiliodielmoense TaxID=1776385 RepID=UPI000A26AFDD|nr:lipase [Clostridium massiliodielmoense]
MKLNLKLKRFISAISVFVFTLVSLITFSVAKPINAFAKENQKVAQNKNNYPIVLCHGCNGWGRNENFGTVAFGARYYWGGNVDLQQKLIENGFTTYTAAVGPLSSNWDRACELYVQIKGGRVDYGEAHAKKHGHSRYGRYYRGFYPQWGTKDENGNIRKVHLIGHSQGGQTVRMLTTLLGQGKQEEISATGEKTSELFKGGHSWISGLITLASPHDGTTLADMKGTDVGAALGIGAMGSILGNISNSDIIFDLKVDQWGLKRRPSESFLSYFNRCAASKMWTSKDICSVDLSTNGAVAQNKWVKAQPNVYYFSWACCGTMRNPISILGHHMASPIRMSDKGLYNPQWALQAQLMGTYSRHNPYRAIPVINSKWWPNDGYVNTISENGPKAGSTDKIVNYNGTPQIGKWNFMGVKDMDHEDIIGRHWNGATNFFIDMAQMLRNLPVTE